MRFPRAVLGVAVVVASTVPATVATAGPAAPSPTDPVRTSPIPGQVCTITGTPGPDVLVGTSGRDVICGLGGDDTLRGLDGDDVLRGGAGHDMLIAGPGDDRVISGPGHDVAMGDAGADTVRGQSGDDALTGGPGPDVLAPGLGANVCDGNVDRVDAIVGTCALDVTGPVISEVMVPANVEAGSSVTFTWRVADPASVQFTGVRVGWASGLYASCGFGEAATLVSGDVSDGAWSYTCDIPATAVSTEYSVQVLSSDMFGNSSNSEWFSFVVSGGVDDATPPDVADVRIVGEARAGEILTTAWTQTDASGTAAAVAWVAGPSGFVGSDQIPYADYATLEIDLGCNEDRTQCAVTQRVRLSASAPAGTYSIWLRATDVNGNSRLDKVLDFEVAAAAPAPPA